MPTARIQVSVSGDVDSSYSKSFEISGGSRAVIQEPIPDGSTDLEVAFSLDVSQAKSFMLVSDQDVTVETNSGSVPDNTFTLSAGVPYVWPQSEGQSFVDTEAGAVSTDITALFVTNTSGENATLRMDSIFDPTV